MQKPIIIGSRGSELALWQANKVKDLLAEKGHESELKIIQSTGDKDRKAKLHEMGLVGVFTKELDDALLIGEIDIAVHSLKDVPTSPPKGVDQCAVLERANPYDALISESKFKETEKFTLASGSLRRRAFWQNKYPEHSLKNLRGNVNTRLKKVESDDIDGIILAKAGLDRLGLSPKNVEILDWMTPAPAQGVVGVFCLNKNRKLKVSLYEINDKNTEICAQVERDLLKALEGGCTAPIGAHAKIIKDSVEVKASLLSEDGKTHIYHTAKKALTSYKKLGKEAAKAILADGGKELMYGLKEAELSRLDSAEAVKSTKLKALKPVFTEEVFTGASEKSAVDKGENQTKPKHLSIKRTKITAKENPVENSVELEIKAAEVKKKKIELKQISIKRNAAAAEEKPTEKTIGQEKVREEASADPNLKSIRIKQFAAPETTAAHRFPKVLCLKKLTLPRINAGRKLGINLTAIEVIETQPDFKSYAVSNALKSTNNWIFSSLNSVSAITSVLKNTSMSHKHVFCVGPRVANFFDGKVKAIHQVNSASELTEAAKTSEKEGFMWFHGSKSDMALIEEFKVHEMTLNTHSVYRTELSTPRIEGLEDYKALLFFSPSGVDSFKEHNYIPESTVISAIGKTTAEYIALSYDDKENTKLENIITPEIYEYEHLLQALQTHFETNGKD